MPCTPPKTGYNKQFTGLIVHVTTSRKVVHKNCAVRYSICIPNFSLSIYIQYYICGLLDSFCNCLMTSGKGKSSTWYRNSYRKKNILSFTFLSKIFKASGILFIIKFYTRTAQSMKFSIKDFFSKCDQIYRNLQIWSHLLMKSLIEYFIFCVVLGWYIY